MFPPAPPLRYACRTICRPLDIGRPPRSSIGRSSVHSGCPPSLVSPRDNGRQAETGIAGIGNPFGCPGRRILVGFSSLPRVNPSSCSLWECRRSRREYSTLPARSDARACGDDRRRSQGNRVRGSDTPPTVGTCKGTTRYRISVRISSGKRRRSDHVLPAGTG
jgi:hypothetical protein